MNVDDMHDKALDLAIKREHLRQELLRTERMRREVHGKPVPKAKQDPPSIFSKISPPGGEKFYRVTAFRSVIKDREVVCSAKSPGEAARKAAKKLMGYSIEGVSLEGSTDHHEVVGLCEACGVGILDGEDYGTDPDGDVMVCGGCGDDGGDE